LPAQLALFHAARRQHHRITDAGAPAPHTMFSERRYDRYKNDYDRQPTNALVWLLCALVAGFTIQLVFTRLLERADIINYAVAFSPDALHGLRLWTLVSHALLHDTRNIVPWHLFVNALVIYFMGREVLPLLGNRRFILVSLAAAAGGALLWLAFNFNTAHTVLIGASAISYALLILFACFNPNTPITVLIFFIIPVSMRPKTIAAIAIAIALGGLVFFELPARQGASAIAHSAHLGGVLVAFAYYFLVHRREWRNPDAIATSLLPGWLRRKKKPAAIASPKYKVNMASSASSTAAPPSAREALRSEVDRILDKINTQGFASLTDAEKHTLDSAKDVFSGNEAQNQ
jgi:membrane associated rhomboid family serine protease